MTINLVAVGERSGELCMICQEIAKYYRKKHELKEFLVKNSLYPVLVLCISLGVLVLFICFILPVLADTYKALGVPIVGLMQVSIIVSNFIAEQYCLVLSIFCIAAFILWKAKFFLQELLLKIPLFRKPYRSFLEVRFCKILALLLECGVNITEAVAEVSATFMDERFVKQLWIFGNMLKRGDNIELAVRCMGNYLSPMTIEMIAIGAETGYLPKLLNEAAKISEENMREYLECVKEVLGPVLLLITAVIVGTIVTSVLKPLFDLFANLPKYV